MGVSLLEHGMNEETLEEARVAPIVIAMRRRMVRNGFGRNETVNIRAVAEVKMEGRCHRGRAIL